MRMQFIKVILLENINVYFIDLLHAESFRVFQVFNFHHWCFKLILRMFQNKRISSFQLCLKTDHFSKTCTIFTVRKCGYMATLNHI